MAKNERSSPRVLKIASKAIKGQKLTKAETKSLGGSVLTQGADKPKAKKKK